MRVKEEVITYDTNGVMIMDVAGGAHFAELIHSNKTASFIMELLKSEITREQIIDTLRGRYTVSTETIEAAVDAIVDSLRNMGALYE